MLTDFRRDLVFAVRNLRSQPTFTVVAVFALTLGIGANVTVFSVVDAMLAFVGKIGDPDRVAFVYGKNLEQEVRQGGLSVDDFLDLQAGARSFEALAVGGPRRANLLGSGDPLRVDVYDASPGFFAALGSPIVLGRGFEPADGEPGAARVAVLGHGFWQGRFGGREDVLGATLSLDGEPTTVIGVVGEGQVFPDRDTAVYANLSLVRGAAPRDARELFALGRLRPGVGSAEATAEAETLFRGLAATYPDTNGGWTASVLTAREWFWDDVRFGMTILYGSITVVLLIACANVASLLLARATTREREIALRRALGAGRLRIVRQLLAESLLLAGAGGALGLAVGLGGLRVLRDMIAADPSMGDIAVDMRLSPSLLLHTLGIAAVSALVFGLVPALRTSRPDLQTTLRDGGRGSAGGARGKRLRGALVTAEVAMALALLGMSGAALRAFGNIYAADPGFEPRPLLTADLALTEREHPEIGQVTSFYERMRSRLAATPGVAAASYASSLPLTLRPGRATVHLAVEGVDEPPEPGSAERPPNAIDVVVGPGYFETLGVPLVAGRTLNEADRDGSLPVAVVSQGTVERHWPDGDPLGQRLRLGGHDEPWRTVVGVVADVQLTSHSLRFVDVVLPEVFVPHAQSPGRSMSLLVRAAGDPAALAADLRRAVASIDPRLPVDRLLTMEQVISIRDTQNTFFVRILSGLSLVALLLAAIGIYGVVSVATTERRQEIGVRVALGARPAAILGLVLRQAALLTAVGLAVGLGLGVAVVRLLSAELAGFAAANAGGPLTFVAVAALFLAVAQLAGFVPARRALKADPVKALRSE